jgi:hypothetical protein
MYSKSNIKRKIACQRTLGFVGSAVVDCKVRCSDCGKVTAGRNHDTTYQKLQKVDPSLSSIRKRQPILSYPRVWIRPSRCENENLQKSIFFHTQKWVFHTLIETFHTFEFLFIPLELFSYLWVFFIPNNMFFVPWKKIHTLGIFFHTFKRFFIPCKICSYLYQNFISCTNCFIPLKSILYLWICFRTVKSFSYFFLWTADFHTHLIFTPITRLSYNAHGVSYQVTEFSLVIFSDAPYYSFTLLSLHPPPRDGCDRHRLHPHARHRTHFHRVVNHHPTVITSSIRTGGGRRTRGM